MPQIAKDAGTKRYGESKDSKHGKLLPIDWKNHEKKFQNLFTSQKHEISVRHPNHVVR